MCSARLPSLYPPAGFIRHSAPDRLKDTIASLKNSQGLAMNITSESFVDNASATAIDTPPGFDEWTISGLTKEKLHLRDTIYALTASVQV